MILLDSLLENHFLSVTEGALDLELLAPQLKTPHLIAAVKPFEELEMCRVSRFNLRGGFPHLKHQQR